MNKVSTTTTVPTLAGLTQGVYSKDSARRTIWASGMTASAKFLCLLINDHASPDGWWTGTYPEIWELAGKGLASNDPVDRCIKEAEETGLLRVRRAGRPNTWKIANSYQVITESPMSPEYGGLEQENHVPAGHPVYRNTEDASRPVFHDTEDDDVSAGQPVYRIPETNTSKRNLTQELEEVSTSLRDDGDELSSSSVSASVPEDGDSKTLTLAAETNPYTKPRVHGNVRADLAICFTCGNRHNNDFHRTLAGETILLCPVCDPDWVRRYTEAVENHRRWEIDPGFRRVIV